MEDFVEDIQQQNTQEEQQAAQVTEEQTETVEAAPSEEYLEEKRDVSNEDVEKHRKLRDELNNQTKEWKAKRDDLNGQVRALVDEAGRCREERDNLNKQVRETKVLRDEWNQKVTALKEQLPPRPEKSGDKEEQVPLKQLKKQLQDLEYQQQTLSMGKDKENAIVKQIQTIAKQIQEREGTLEASEEVKGIVAELREAKAQAETYHRQVSEFAEQAQAAHDKMIDLYGKADALRKEADAAQAEFIRCKQAADEEHKKHIEGIKSVHQFEKDANKGGRKKEARGAKRADDQSKKEAKEIFDRFKAGEKLSVEDLMILQKSGVL